MQVEQPISAAGLRRDGSGHVLPQSAANTLAAAWAWSLSSAFQIAPIGVSAVATAPWARRYADAQLPPPAWASPPTVRGSGWPPGLGRCEPCRSPASAAPRSSTSSTCPTPVPADGEVLYDISSSGVNFAATHH